jgi:hypothetical protein
MQRQFLRITNTVRSDSLHYVDAWLLLLLLQQQLSNSYHKDVGPLLCMAKTVATHFMKWLPACGLLLPAAAAIISMGNCCAQRLTP